MYIPTQRRNYILRLLEARGHLRSAELARELDVTDETIRMDLVTLEKKGLLKRVHGGARYILPKTGQTSDERLATQLAERAAKHIGKGAIIFLEDSIYARALLNFLQEIDCHIITNSLGLVKRISAEAFKPSVSALGGQFDKKSKLVVDEIAREQLKCYKLSHCILSPDKATPTQVQYKTASQGQMAQIASRIAEKNLIIIEAGQLEMEMEGWEVNYQLLVTENALPEEWVGGEMELVEHVESIGGREEIY